MKKTDLKDTEVKYFTESDIKRKKGFFSSNIKIDKWFVILFGGQILASLMLKMLQINFRVEKEVEKEDDEVFRDSKNPKEGRRPVYIYLLLLSGYILYLTLGGMRALRFQGYSDVGDFMMVIF